MSVVTNLILAIGDDDADDNKIIEVNDFFERDGKLGLVSVEDSSLPKGWYGGSKYLEARFYIGAFNYLELTDFYDYLRTLKWKSPDQVQIIVNEQEELVFRLINVFSVEFERSERRKEWWCKRDGQGWPPNYLQALQILQRQRFERRSGSAVKRRVSPHRSRRYK